MQMFFAYDVRPHSSDASVAKNITGYIFLIIAKANENDGVAQHLNTKPCRYILINYGVFMSVRLRNDIISGKNITGYIFLIIAKQTKMMELLNIWTWNQVGILINYGMFMNACLCNDIISIENAFRRTSFNEWYFGVYWNCYSVYCKKLAVLNSSSDLLCATKL